jgi:predicted transcriptional regulator
MAGVRTMKKIKDERPATIRDIAEASGFSVSAVSSC